MAEGRWVGERPPPGPESERTFKVKNSIGPGVNCGQHIHRSDDQGGRNVRGSLNTSLAST
jgi:hypothetical protein